MEFFLTRLSRHLFVFALMGGLALFARAEPLPAPDTLAARLGKAPQNLTVLEPHLLAADLPAKRTYQGYPASQLLDLVLGRAWRAPGNEVAFLALDGYISRIPSEDIVRHEPLLAIAIRGQSDFTVDRWAYLWGRTIWFGITCATSGCASVAAIFGPTKWRKFGWTPSAKKACSTLGSPRRIDARPSKSKKLVSVATKFKATADKKCPPN